MKRIFLFIFVMIGFGGAWIARGAIRDALYQAKQPKLPVAETYQVTTSTVVIKNNKSINQENKSAELPGTINLAVPFLLQAPTHDWSQPYQDACEEAAAIMVDAYYKGRRERYREEDGNKAILEFIAFEERLLGKYKDTTAEEIARLIREYFKYKTVLVREIKNLDEVKQMLAKGYPVIVPAHGKSLNNPYFRNGGPVYHMLVIKGYLKDGRWIVNDPGIGRGPDYVYQSDVLWKAIHDFDGGNVLNGKKMMIVVMPN